MSNDSDKPKSDFPKGNSTATANLDIIYTENFSLTRPKKYQKAHPVPVSDWKFIKSKIEKIRSPSVIFQNIGFILFTFAFSALLSLLTLPNKSNDLIINLWAILIGSFLMGCLSFLYYGREKKSRTRSKEEVLEEMNRIEERFLLDDEQQNKKEES